MTTQTPMVSVIIPTFNRALMTCRAIQSVFNQSFNNYELIVVDDGSTDNTSAIIKKYWDGRINYIRLLNNIGGSHARNIGIKKAKGKYIAFLDSDDEWLPLKLEKQVEFFEKCKPLVGAVYCLYYKKKDTLKKFISKKEHGYIYDVLLCGWCPSITSSIMIRNDVFKQGNNFDETLTSFQDYDLWIRIAKTWNFEVIKEYLVINHEHHEDRVGINLGPRIKGLNLFLNKWEGAIYEIGGYQAVDLFRRKYLSLAYSHEALDKLRKHERQVALHLFNRLLKTRRITPKFFIKFFILFLGNKKLYIFARRIHRNIMNLSDNEFK